MTILVEIDSAAGQRNGDWIVKSGRRIISRHRLKRRAVERARREARQRGTVLKIQNVDGTWRTEATY